MFFLFLIYLLYKCCVCRTLSGVKNFISISLERDDVRRVRSEVLWLVGCCSAQVQVSLCKVPDG